MFPELTGIVELLREGAGLFSRLRSNKERRGAILQLLRTYFMLMDCVDEAEALLAEAGRDPAATLAGMESADAGQALERWELALRVQTSRLYTLAGEIKGQQFLAVVSPELQKQIDDIAGTKMDRDLSLSGIVAALVIRFEVGLGSSRGDIAGYVALMAGVEGGQLDMVKIAAEVAEFRFALEKYRAVVERMASNDEIMKLSRDARNDANRWPKVYASTGGIAAGAATRSRRAF